MRYCILLAAVSAALFGGAQGFSKGAPKDVCEDMTPKHPASPQTRSSNPYIIKLSKTKIRSGQTVDVTITGYKRAEDEGVYENNDFAIGRPVKAGKNGETIKGFMLEARVGETPVGQFSSSKDVQTLDCGSGKRTAATHTNSDVKKEVKVTWTAPAGLKETVYMHATVAKDGATFWVNQKSRSIVVS